MHFVNGFKFRKIPERLITSTVSISSAEVPISDIEKEQMIYQATARAAKLLCENVDDQIVASFGRELISVDSINNLSSFDFRYGNRLYLGLKLEIISEKTVSWQDESFHERLRNYLNKKTELLFLSENYQHDERFFTKDSYKIGPYLQRIGVVVRTMVYPNLKSSYLQVDYTTRLERQGTLWSLLKEHLENDGVYWRETDPSPYNKIGWRAKRLKTTYTVLRRGTTVHLRYRFRGFDFEHGIDEEIDGIVPLEYHRERGQSISETDQPVVWIESSSGQKFPGVPSLLLETTDLHRLKRHNPRFSLKVQSHSLLDAESRYLSVYEHMEPFIEMQIFDWPEEQPAISLSPIYLTMGDSHLAISKDEDFSKFYTLKKIEKPPKLSHIVLSVDSRLEEEIKNFWQLLKKSFQHFNIQVECTIEKFETSLQFATEAYFREYTKFLIDLGKKLEQTALLMFVTPGKESKRSDTFRWNIKQKLTIELKIATQMLSLEKIKSTEPLESGYVETLFLQLVAKMGGIPFLFQEGITLPDTVFVGLDRHMDPEKELPSVTAAVTVLSNKGEYLSAATSSLDARSDDALGQIKYPFFEALDQARSQYEFENIVVLRDTGPGTFSYLSDEEDQIFDVLEKLGMNGAFLTANKSSGWRIYEGEPAEGDAQRPDQFIAVTDFFEPKQILLATTEPMITKTGELGTPLPMLYEIRRSNISFPLAEIKASLARGLVSMARLSWVSRKATRLPVPLDYAHKLAAFCAKVGSSWPSTIKEPLYL